VRRIATWLLVGAVAALGTAAAVDALRSEERVSRPVAETPALPGLADQPELAMRQLREAGVTGVLTYSDEDCRLHAVSLPELRPVHAPSFEMCRPATSAGGLGAVDGDVVWAGLGYGTVQVVVSQEELTRAVMGPGFPADAEAGYRAVQAVSLDEREFLVLADSLHTPDERVLVAFQDGRMRFVHPDWEIGGAQSIRRSPGGRYYALLGSAPLGAQVFMRDGHAVGVPDRVPTARAVAWSPDERWTALATDTSVYVYPTSRPDELVVRIPLAVHDLAWE
jgi:hypothetical protein